MSFIPINYEDGKTVLMPVANSVTTVRGGCMIDDGSGYLTPAAAGCNFDIHYVSAEVVTTTAAGQLVMCWETHGVKFLADTDAAWAQTNIGLEVDLASVSTLDIDAVTDQLFYVERGVGTAGTDTQVEGYFTLGVPNLS